MARRRPLTHAERRIRTRRRLLDAAAEAFARGDYQSASLDQIASRAGYSTGAIYGHFKSKEDLFRTLVDEHAERLLRRYEEAFERANTFDEWTRAAADEWMAYLREEPTYFPLYMLYWNRALHSKSLRSQLLEHKSRLKLLIADLIERGAREHLGIPLPRNLAEQVAMAVIAMGDGLAMEKLANPEGVSEEFFGGMLVTFSGVLATLGQQRMGDHELAAASQYGPRSPA